MDSVFAAIFVGPCIRIKLFGYEFGGCVESKWAVVTGQDPTHLALYFGPFGQTSLEWGQLSFLLINLGLMTLAGLAVRFAFIKRQQKTGLEIANNIQIVRADDTTPLKARCKISKLSSISKIIFLSMVMLALLFVFFPYMLPGIACAFFVRNQLEIPFSIAASGGLFVIYRLVYFNMDVNIVYPNDGFGMILNWAVAFAIFLAGLRIPRYFREGFRTICAKDSAENQQNLKDSWQA